jgi:hypothetical protein
VTVLVPQQDELDALALHKLFAENGALGIRALAWFMRECGWHVAVAPSSSLEVLIDHNSGRRRFRTLFEILMATEEGREALALASRLVIKPTE